jgi:4-aminobutyrate aminotransferase-like enzyme
VVCAAALAVQKALKSDYLMDNVKAMGTFLGAQLYCTLSVLDHVGDIRGRGLFWAVEFVAEKETRTSFPQDQVLALDVVESAFEYGLIIQSGISSAMLSVWIV